MLPISGKTLIGLGIFVLLLALGGTLWRCHIGSFGALDSAFLEMVCPAGRLADWPGVTVYHGLFSALAKTWIGGFATLAVGMLFCWLESPSRQIARSQDFEHRDVSTESAGLPPPHYPAPTAAPLWAEDFSFIPLNGLLWQPRWGLCLFTSNGRLDFIVISGAKIYGPRRAGALIGAPHSRADERAHDLFGSPDAPAAMALAFALQLRARERGEDEARVQLLRDRLQAQLVAGVPGLVVNGVSARRLAGSLQISSPHIPGDVAMAKDMQAARIRGDELGLSPEEVAFYMALAENKSALEAMGDKKLRVIAHELLRSYATTPRLTGNTEKAHALECVF